MEDWRREALGKSKVNLRVALEIDKVCDKVVDKVCDEVLPSNSRTRTRTKDEHDKRNLHGPPQVLRYEVTAFLRNSSCFRAVRC